MAAVPTWRFLSEEIVIRVTREGLWEAVAYFGQQRKPGGVLLLQLALIKTPAPVPAVNAGRVHAGFAAESENILEWDDAQTSRRTLGSADEGPVNAIIAVAEICFGIAALMLGGARVPPSLNCIVVVSSRVDDLSC